MNQQSLNKNNSKQIDNLLKLKSWLCQHNEKFIRPQSLSLSCKDINICLLINKKNSLKNDCAILAFCSLFFFNFKLLLDLRFDAKHDTIAQQRMKWENSLKLKLIQRVVSYFHYTKNRSQPLVGFPFQYIVLNVTRLKILRFYLYPKHKINSNKKKELFASECLACKQ